MLWAATATIRLTFHLPLSFKPIVHVLKTALAKICPSPSFECYLVERVKSYALLTDVARPLRDLFRRQLEGKTLITTSSSKRFRREFCDHGIVLDSSGQILFEGEISTALDWSEQNLESSEEAELVDDSFEMGSEFQNKESSGDSDDDF